MQKSKLKFTDKNHTVGGVLSTIMGIASIVCYVYAVYLSFKSRGEGGAFVGGMALLLMVLSVFGLIIGFLSYREKEKYYLFSFIGTLLCGIMTIFMIAIYMTGL